MQRGPWRQLEWIITMQRLFIKVIRRISQQKIIHGGQHQLLTKRWPKKLKVNPLTQMLMIGRLAAAMIHGINNGEREEWRIVGNFVDMWIKGEKRRKR